MPTTDPVLSGPTITNPFVTHVKRAREFIGCRCLTAEGRLATIVGWETDYYEEVSSDGWWVFDADYDVRVPRLFSRRVCLAAFMREISGCGITLIQDPRMTVAAALRPYVRLAQGGARD